MFLILFALVTFLYLYYKHKESFFKNQGLKGPTPLPIIGTAHQLLIKPTFEYDYLNFSKFGPIYVDYSVFGKSILVTADQNMIRQFMIKDFTNFILRLQIPFMPPTVRRALIFIDPTRWRRVRTVVTPIFTTSKIKRLYKAMQRSLDQSMDNFQQLIDQRKNVNFDAKEMAKWFSVDTIAHVVFASQLNSFKQRDNSFVVELNKLLQVQPLTILLGSVLPSFLMKALKVSFFNKNAAAYFSQKADQIVESRRKQPEVKYDDFLQLLMEAEEETQKDVPKEKHIEREEVLGQCLMFFFAGMETISTTISNALYELALNPDIQERLHNELLKTHPIDREVLYDDLNACKYLDLFVKELLRRHASVSRLFRTAAQDYEFENGLRIRKGQTVMLPVYSVHHDPNTYPDPFKFDPMRFENGIPENAIYLPFGDGPRNCVGMRFALVEVKSFLIHFVRRFQVFATERTDCPPKYKKGILLVMYDNLYLRVEARKEEEK